MHKSLLLSLLMLVSCSKPEPVVLTIPAIPNCSGFELRPAHDARLDPAITLLKEGQKLPEGKNRTERLETARIYAENVARQAARETAELEFSRLMVEYYSNYGRMFSER